MPKILIVGGGIAGLSLARALRQRGQAPSKIVERSAQRPTEGAGIYLPVSAFRALETLGLGQEILPRAVVIERQRFLDDRGRVVTRVQAEPSLPICSF